MSILRNPRLGTSNGPSVLSRRPIVLLRAAPLAPETCSFLTTAWDTALQTLIGGLERVAANPTLLRADPPHPLSKETCHLCIGDLVARLATILMRKAAAPEGDFEAIPGPGREVAAYWNDWMEGVGVLAGRQAIKLMELAFAEPAALERAVPAALSAVFAARLDSFYAPMVQAAEARGLPWHSLRRGFPVLAYGQGARQQWFHGTMSNRQSRASVHLTSRKHLSIGLLRAAGLPVPEHRLVNSAAEARTAAEKLGFPLVVKPNAGSRAANIWLNLSSEDAVVEAFETCQRLGMRTLVEKQYPGLPYRVTVCNGRAFGALLHAVPCVVGDGRTRLRDLIERTNRSRHLAVADDYILPTPLRTEEFAEQMEWRLHDQGITLNDIPAAGRRVFLTLTPALGRGGLHVDVTEQMHPDTLSLAEEAARILHASHLGVDFLITDITKPHSESPLVINEVNAAPGVRSHIFVEGPPRDMAEAVLAPYFPPGDEGRIPIAAALGSTATACLPLLVRLLTAAGETAGYADSDKAHVDGYTLRPAEGVAAHPGRALLRDKRPSIAAMAFDFGDVLHRGLPSDRLDVVALGRDVLTGEMQASQRRALETLVALPGSILILPLEAEAGDLRDAAAHRRLILVADEPDGDASRPRETTLVAAERKADSVWIGFDDGYNRNPLGRIPLDAYRTGLHAWAAALLLGLGLDALTIARLTSTQGGTTIANRAGRA